MANLSAFREKIGYGIRPNLFKVTLGTKPTGLSDVSSIGDAEKVSFLCRSAGIPASNLGTVEVPFRGRVIKLPGDRTFESWTITLFADQNLEVRNYLESWMGLLNQHGSGGGITANYTADLTVDMLARGKSSGSAPGDVNAPHTVIKSYKFLKAFPTNISQIDLSYDNNNSIAEYTVEFQYDYWIAQAGASGSQNNIVGDA